jgi:hypothetical protein
MGKLGWRMRSDVRKLLVVTPDALTTRWGGERVRKLTMAFAQNNWATILLVPPPWSYERIHPGSRSPLPGKGIDVRRAFDANPYVLGSLIRRGLSRPRPSPGISRTSEEEKEAVGGKTEQRPGRRLALGLIDKMMIDYYAGWVPFAIAQGLRIIRKDRPVAMFSSFPPPSSHVVALALHRRTGLPWIADFRDPWSRAHLLGYDWPPRRLWDRLEERVCREADLVTTVGANLSEDVASHYGVGAETLWHGFDRAPFEGDVGRVSNAVLTLLHAGSIEAWKTDLDPLVRGLRSLAADGLPVMLILTGEIDGLSPLASSAAADGLLRVEGFVSKARVFEWMSAADVGLVINTQPSPTYVSSKQWEYLAAAKPALAIVDPEGEAARIIRETGSGWVVPYWDESEIVRCLREIHARWRAGELERHVDMRKAAGLEASRISSRFVELLERVAEDRPD